MSIDGAVPDQSSLHYNEEVFPALVTTPKAVFDILSCLPVKKAPGADGITTRLLRGCARGIAGSLALLFNRSFSECTYPSAWKDALVIPVFKRGERSSLSSYRPISLLCVVGKVCERIVFNKLSFSYASPV